MKVLIFILSFVILFANIENNNKETNISKEEKFIISQLLQNEFYLNYLSYLNYNKLRKELNKYAYLARKNPKYKEKYKSIKTQLELLKENKDIFSTMIKLKKIPKPPQVNNPFQIFNAINYEKELENIKTENENIYENFKNTFNLIKKLQKLKQNTKNDKLLNKMLEDFEILNSVYITKLKTLNTQIQLYKKEIKQKIEKEINKLIFLIVLIVLSILFFTFLKIVIKKYIKEESAYIVNKILNFINFTIIILIISFFYINNVTYLVTILGFASAGIAIAMKDWFMNIFGWFVIMAGGNFKVGDRIKIYLQNGNVKIVGDVIDITLTKIILYEDVTLTTYLYNRRAGRIVFVPNNVVFNNPIFNYTHNGLNTVWDGIDITITFDSNYKKAVYLVKEIVNKYSKGYTDITKRRIKKLKTMYNIKTANVEPKIYTFIEENGIRISCWFLNNYITLSLRSNISAEIIEAFNKENDIKIAYPTQKIFLEKEDEKFIKT